MKADAHHGVEMFICVLPAYFGSNDILLKIFYIRCVAAWREIFLVEIMPASKDAIRGLLANRLVSGGRPSVRGGVALRRR